MSITAAVDRAIKICYIIGMKKVIFTFLQFTWGIIQNLSGLVCLLWLMLTGKHGRIYRFKEAVVTDWERRDSVALGMFVFFGHGRDENAPRMLRHEYGHTVQSVILGPFFLPVIGLPSFIWAAGGWKRKKKKGSYFDFYTEHWADRLGGVFEKK